MVDYVVMSPLLLAKIQQFEVLPFDGIFSDCHCLLECSWKLGGNPMVTPDGDFDDAAATNDMIDRPKWDDAMVPAVKNSLNNLNCDDFIRMIDSHDVNTVLDIFCEKIDEVYREAQLIRPVVVSGRAPKARKTEHWFDKTCKLKRQLYFKAKRLAKSGGAAGYEVLRRVSVEYRNAIKAAKSRFARTKRRQLRSCYNNPKEYWRLLDFKYKKPTIPVSSRQFYKYFAKLHEGTHDVRDEHVLLGDVDVVQYDVDMLNNPITDQEILKVVSSLKSGKSPGEDNILNEVIKLSVNNFLPFYNKLFNYVLDSGIFPDSWASGLIVPLFKNNGDVNDPSCYRGITLLSCVGKLFNSVLHKRLEKFSSENNIMSKCQAGFQKSQSTTDHIFVLKCLVDLYVKQNKNLFVAWVDYAKAYDSVWRNGLWCKLLKQGIKGKVVDVIKDLYSKAKSKIFVNRTVSQSFVTNTGVRQGDVLSPYLFCLYVNDLEDFLERCKVNPVRLRTTDIDGYLKWFVVLFADDLALVSDTAENLQMSLDALHDYSTMWKLTVNCDKTKITVFGKKVVDFVWSYNGVVLDVTKDFKYLGVVFSSDGSFRSQVLRAKEQGRKAMFSILAKSREVSLPISVQIDLFKKLVMPILTYGCEVWGFQDASCLDKLQLSYLRFILRLNANTPIPMLYGETGLLPVSQVIKTRMLKFYAKLVDPDTKTLSRDVFLSVLLYENTTRVSSKWLKCIENIFIELGDHGTFVSKATLNKCYLVWSKGQLRDVFLARWFNDLNRLTKCDTYRAFKTVFGQEGYLDYLPPELAISLCKFRTSNHRLEIETMRRLPNVPRSERWCSKCGSGELSSEYHHVLYCTAFTDLRKRFIASKVVLKPNYVKFLSLMSSGNQSVTFNLAKFIKLSMYKY